MLDWLIVGGGIHGTFLSHYLVHKLGVPRDRLCVLDPHKTPLACWDVRTVNTGMAFMRSTRVHHLGLTAVSLCEFAQGIKPPPRFLGPYHRPAYTLFQAHAAHVIRQHRLEMLRVVGRAEGLLPCRGGWCVETAWGDLEARWVLLAIGRTQLHWPDWAVRLHKAGAPVHHVFDLDFRRAALSTWSHAVVVGGGITAAQTTLALAARGLGTVTLLMRHPIRQHSFDSDPCWIGAKCLHAFDRVKDPDRRRSIIERARYRGSMPPEVVKQVQIGVKAGTLDRRQGEVVSARLEAGNIVLTLVSGESLCTDRLLLATGFEASRPGGAWLDRAIATNDLPCARCGYPIVNRSLRWAPGLYVTGPLAELALGPVAANIVGARLTAKRMVDVA